MRCRSGRKNDDVIPRACRHVQPNISQRHPGFGDVRCFTGTGSFAEVGVFSVEPNIAHSAVVTRLLKPESCLQARPLHIHTPDLAGFVVNCGTKGCHSALLQNQHLIECSVAFDTQAKSFNNTTSPRATRSSRSFTAYGFEFKANPRGIGTKRPTTIGRARRPSLLFRKILLRHSHLTRGRAWSMGRRLGPSPRLGTAADDSWDAACAGPQYTAT